jgi:hypothetical protein
MKYLEKIYSEHYYQFLQRKILLFKNSHFYILINIDEEMEFIIKSTVFYLVVYNNSNSEIQSMYCKQMKSRTCRIQTRAKADPTRSRTRPGLTLGPH